MVKNKGVFLNITYCFAFVSALGLGIVLPGTSMAQVDTAKVRQLEEVKITEYKNARVNLSPAPVQILIGTDLKRLNSLSVADAIRYFSGVQLKDYGGIGGLKTINVRSMGSNHTAVFYDGIQLGNAQNGQVDLGRYSLDNIEAIELYSGQKSELLQPAKAYASASSLFLKTPIPKFENGSTQNFRLALKTGSFGLLNPAVTYNQKLTNRLTLSLNAELTNANGKYKYRYTNGVYDTTVVRSNADIFAKRIEAGFYGITADSAQWQVKFYNYNSERGIPGAIVSNKFDFTQRQWDSNFFVQSSFNNKISSRYQLLVNAKYANDYLRYLDPDYKKLTGPLDNRYRQQEAYLSVANKYTVTHFWSVGLSADYNYQKLAANLTDFAYPTRQTALIALATSLKWPQFNIEGNVLATVVNDEVKNNTPAGDRTEFTPAVLASWQPFANSNLRVRSFYKSIFRMPTFNDLYYTFVGNSALKPEYTHQYDLGLTYAKVYQSKLKKLSLQVDGYYNLVKDKIVAIPTVNLFRWTMVNLDRVEITGLEMNMQSEWQFGQVGLNGRLSYTYEKALDKTTNGLANNFDAQIPYIPVNSGSFTLSANYKSYSLNYSYIYTGERYSQKANIPENYVEPFYTSDVSLQKSFSYAKSSYRIGLEVNNVFNQYYDVVLNYPMPGTNLKLTLVANF